MFDIIRLQQVKLLNIEFRADSIDVNTTANLDYFICCISSMPWKCNHIFHQISFMYKRSENFQKNKILLFRTLA